MATNVSGTLKGGCPISLDFNPQNFSNFPKTAISSCRVASIVTAITAPPTISINLLVIWIVIEDERLRSTSYNLLLAVLSLSDLLVGLLAEPLFVGLNLCIIYRCPNICTLTTSYAISIMLCGGWSLGTTMMISLERYLAIEYPLYHRTKIKTKKVMMLTGAIWVVFAAIIVTCRLLFNRSYKTRQLPVAIFIAVCSVIILFCLTKIFLRTRRQRTAINVLTAAVQPMHNQKLKEYKRTLTLGLVVVASVLFYVPSLIAKIIGVTKGREWNDDTHISQSIWVTILHIQSLVNPLILSLRLSYIGKGVKKKLLCKFD